MSNALRRIERGMIANEMKKKGIKHKYLSHFWDKYKKEKLKEGMKRRGVI